VLSFHYIIRCAFNGAIRPGAAFSHGQRQSVNLKEWPSIRDRLKDVVIVLDDFERVLTLYDTPETFYYLDPPYLCCIDRKDYYQHNLTLKDHQRLRGILERLKGNWLLSLDNSPEAHQLYGDREFHIETIPVTYSDHGELLISNYEPLSTPFYQKLQQGYTHQDLEGGYTPTAGPGGYTHGGPAPFTIPNCPSCHGRHIQSFYTRHSKLVAKGKRRRTFKGQGLWCADCERTFPKLGEKK